MYVDREFASVPEPVPSSAPMTLSRRDWLATTGIGMLGVEVAASLPLQGRVGPNGFDPWLEIDPAALAHNAQTLSRLTGGRPILAMVKNNCYGLGLETTPRLLERSDAIWGFGVVRPIEAYALRRAGVRKPVVLLGPAADDESHELARQDVTLALLGADQQAQLVRLAAGLQRPVPVHLYVDTGMHRMGIPHQVALQVLESAELRKAIRIEGALTELVEDQDFDRTQAERLRELARTASSRGYSLGRLHAASSDAIARPTPETFLDLIRPGLALFGGYPTAESLARAELRLAYRLKARVMRVDRLEPGEGVSYHRRFTASGATETATLAIGHVDGYPAGATRGAEVLVGSRLYPVVGTVSASHTVINLGLNSGVQVGDEAILVGPDRPALHPNVVAERSQWSEYNMFMHLHPGLRRQVF
jgi:alanine racemase